MCYKDSRWGFCCCSFLQLTLSPHDFVVLELSFELANWQDTLSPTQFFEVLCVTETPTGDSAGAASCNSLSHYDFIVLQLLPCPVLSISVFFHCSVWYVSLRFSVFLCYKDSRWGFCCCSFLQFTLCLHDFIVLELLICLVLSITVVFSEFRCISLRFSVFLCYKDSRCGFCCCSFLQFTCSP